MASILDMYDAMQSQLGVDTISYNQGRAQGTPYSLDDSLEIDEDVLTDSFLQFGRKGTVTGVMYSSTIDLNG